MGIKYHYKWGSMVKSKINYNNKLYKIRRKSDGLFSCGTTNPRFSKHGKLYKRQHLSTHLAQFSQKSLSQYYGNCEIVEYEVTELETSSYSLEEYIFDKLI